MAKYVIKIKDADPDIVEKLIKDEEDAINNYAQAIEKARETGDEASIARYQHILDEEMEHIQELKDLLANDPIKDSKYIKDSTYLERRTEEILKEVPHTADYLWTWDDESRGPDFAYVVRSSSFEDKRKYTRQDAIALLNEYYTKLQREVNRKLKSGYEAKLKRLNIIWDHYDSKDKGED